MSANPLSNHTPQKVIPKIQQKPANYGQYKAIGLSPSKPPLIAARPLAPLLPATAQPASQPTKPVQPIKRAKNDGMLLQQPQQHHQLQQSRAGQLTQEQLNQIAAALQHKNGQSIQPISNGQFYQFIPIQSNGVKLQQPLIIAPVPSSSHLLSQPKNSNIQPKPAQPYLHSAPDGLGQFIFQTVSNKAASVNHAPSNGTGNQSSSSSSSSSSASSSQPVHHQLSTTSTNIQLLQQRLAEEEQRQEQLLKQLNEKKSNSLKVKSPEKKTKCEDAMEVDEPAHENDKCDETINSSTNTSQNKKRGRPRLYAVDATTGKSIKGKLIDNAPIKQKPYKMNIQPHLQLPSGIAIYPSPSTSTSSSYSQPNFIINPPAQFNTQFIPLNIVQPMIQEEKMADDQTTKSHEVIEKKQDVSSPVRVEDPKETEDTHEQSSEKENIHMDAEHKDTSIEASVHKTPEQQAKKVVDTLKNLKSQVVLTHVIDGFVIKESSKPFPVRPNDVEMCIEQNTPPKSTSTPFNNKKREEEVDKLNTSRLLDDHSLLNTSNSSQKSKGKSKSKISPKKPRKSLSDEPENKNVSANGSHVTPSNEWPSGDPNEWDRDQVYAFVVLVAGQQVAEMFRSQEMDGPALSLIRDDHLVNTMGVKLGPALKIMSKFNELKIKFSQSL